MQSAVDVFKEARLCIYQFCMTNYAPELTAHHNQSGLLFQSMTRTLCDTASHNLFLMATEH